MIWWCMRAQATCHVTHSGQPPTAWPAAVSRMLPGQAWHGPAACACHRGKAANSWKHLSALSRKDPESSITTCWGQKPEHSMLLK